MTGTQRMRRAFTLATDAYLKFVEAAGGKLPPNLLPSFKNH